MRLSEVTHYACDPNCIKKSNALLAAAIRFGHIKSQQASCEGNNVIFT